MAGCNTVVSHFFVGRKNNHHHPQHQLLHQPLARFTRCATFAMHMAHNPIKSLAGQTAVYGMGTIIPRLLNYFLVPLYTRVFAEDIYGQITELYAYVAFLLVLLTYGMETAFFRYAQKNDSIKVFNNAFSAILLSSSVFLLLLLLFYQPMAAAIRYSGNPEYVIFIGLIVALDALTAIPFALLRKQNKARRFATIKLWNVAVNIGLNLIFILAIPKVSIAISDTLFGHNEGLLIWVFIANFVASLLSLLMLLPQMRQYRWEIDKKLVRPMLNYALPVLVVGLAGMVNEVIDKILLKYLLPDQATAMAELGIYGANFKLGVLMTLFIQMFRYAAEPFFFAEAEKKDAPSLFARVMNYFVVTGLLIFLLVMLYLDLFQYFIGKSFREGIFIVPIILMANLFYGIFFNLSVWYKLTDRTSNGALISILGAAITIGLNILLIPLMGYVGAAWARFSCYAVMMAVSFWWGQRIFPIPYQLGRLLLYFVAAMLIYVVALQTAELPVYGRLALNTLLFTLFAGSAFYFERKNPLATTSNQ